MGQMPRTENMEKEKGSAARQLRMSPEQIAPGAFKPTVTLCGMQERFTIYELNCSAVGAAVK
jgi:hypothetical protein